MFKLSVWLRPQTLSPPSSPLMTKVPPETDEFNTLQINLFVCFFNKIQSFALIGSELQPIRAQDCGHGNHQQDPSWTEWHVDLPVFHNKPQTRFTGFHDPTGRKPGWNQGGTSVKPEWNQSETSVEREWSRPVVGSDWRETPTVMHQVVAALRKR